MKRLSFLLLGFFIFALIALSNAYGQYDYDYPVASTFRAPILGLNWSADSALCGYKEGWGYHAGEDMILSPATPVYAVANGRVKQVKTPSKGYGAVVVIEHYTGKEFVCSIYGHLSTQLGLQVEVGQIVLRKDLIGYVAYDYEDGGCVDEGGNLYVCNGPWDPHLHLGIKRGKYDGTYPGYESDCPTVQKNFYSPTNFIQDHKRFPLSGDWNGDGIDASGYFEDNVFFLDNLQPIPFGLPQDFPIIGDWDGNGQDEIGVFRPKEKDSDQSSFYLVDGNEVRRVSFGFYPQDIPIVGDWDNDGYDDIGGYYTYTFSFYIYQLNRNQVPWQSELYKDVKFGDPGDYPIIGDWDKNGSDDIGIFRVSTSTNLFYIDIGLTGGSAEYGPFPFGDIEDMPLIGDWDGDGDDNIGVYRPSTSQFFVDNNVPDITPGVDFADFIANTTSGYIPLPVSFTDTSTGEIVSWSWDFGDGGTSTEQNPQHTYNQAGTYTVSLTVTSSLGTDSKVKIDYISVSSPGDICVLSGTVTLNGGPVDPMMTSVQAIETSGANQGNNVQVTEQGQYQMALFPGTYNVAANIGYNESWAGTWTTMHIWNYPGAQNLNFSSDSTLDIAATCYVLSGTVRNTSGQGIPNVSLSIPMGANFESGTKTSSAPGSVGMYKMYVLPGTYSIQVTSPPAQFPPFMIKKIQINDNLVRDIILSNDYSVYEAALNMISPDLDLFMDVFDILDLGFSKVYDISFGYPKDSMQLIVNWGGSTIQVDLYTPAGALYGQYQSSTPPIKIDILNPEVGNWKVSVTAIDIPYDNYPFALVSAVTPNKPPVAEANGPYSGKLGLPIQFDAGGSYDPDGEIILYEWDFDNDGIFETVSTLPSINHTWNTEFSGYIGLRVRDNEGLFASDSATLTVGGGTEVIDVDIDIKPGSDPNSINLRSKGKVPVAVLGKADFNATEINPATVTLAGVLTKLKNKGDPMASFEDVNKDGILDAIVHFETSALQLSETDIEAILEGETYDGRRFCGKDSIRITK